MLFVSYSYHFRGAPYFGDMIASGSAPKNEDELFELHRKIVQKHGGEVDNLCVLNFIKLED